MASITQLPTSFYPVNRWFTPVLFDSIFPYAVASSVYACDGQPFWRYADFVNAIGWLNMHPNRDYHGFGAGGAHTINQLEVAAFLANTHQETGDPSLLAPYPWAYPPITTDVGVAKGPAGGLLSVIEGSAPIISFPDANGACPFGGKVYNLSPTAAALVGTPKLCVGVNSLATVKQAAFGFGAGTNTGCVMQPGLVAVTGNGTLYGNNPQSINTAAWNRVQPFVANPTGAALENPALACPSNQTSCQYSGRGAIQLSYNFNYTDCSMALFGDYRLAKWPNLLITTDRNNPTNLPGMTNIDQNTLNLVFGFPGGLPDEVKNTTPPARMLAWITALWFWMDKHRSGFSFSCHDAMQDPTHKGITTVNLIVNNDSGCQNGSWAWNKNQYYQRICGILGVDWAGTIVCPAYNSKN